VRSCNIERTSQVAEWSVPRITAETFEVAKNILQDSVQNRDNEHTEDVAMLLIPKETDKATWLIPLKRFSERVGAQIVDVLVTRIQERLACSSFLKSLSDSGRYAIIDCRAMSEEPS